MMPPLPVLLLLLALCARGHVAATPSVIELREALAGAPRRTNDGLGGLSGGEPGPSAPRPPFPPLALTRDHCSVAESMQD